MSLKHTLKHYNLNFKGKKGEHWTIWLQGRSTYTVPVAAQLFDEDASMLDRAENPQLVLANSFDFVDGMNMETLLQAGQHTLSYLLKVTERVSFIDIRPLDTN